MPATQRRACSSCKLALSVEVSAPMQRQSPVETKARTLSLPPPRTMGQSRPCSISRSFGSGFVAKANICKCLVEVPEAETEARTLSSPPQRSVEQYELARSLRTSWRLRCKGKHLQVPDRSARGRETSIYRESGPASHCESASHWAASAAGARSRPHWSGAAEAAGSGTRPHHGSRRRSPLGSI